MPHPCPRKLDYVDLVGRGPGPRSAGDRGEDIGQCQDIYVQIAIGQPTGIVCYSGAKPDLGKLCCWRQTSRWLGSVALVKVANLANRFAAAAIKIRNKRPIRKVRYYR